MIAGVVLAAGSSSRLGHPKQLLPVRGEPLLRHTVRRILASTLDEIIVVVGHEADAVRAALADLPVQVVGNPDYERGQSTSLLAGLAALSPDAEAVVFLLGDQPGVDPAVIDALINAWRETGAPVVAPRYADGLGNPVLFARDVFPELSTLTGDTGARSVVRAHRRGRDLHIVGIPEAAPPDIDTDADYATLLATLESERDDTPLPGSWERGQGCGNRGPRGSI